MIRFVVALDCEAKPLLAHYRLRRNRGARGFPLYQSDDGRDIALIVSGVGQTAAAAATAYLAAVDVNAGKQQQSAWINAGVGGHARSVIGDIYLAHRVSGPDGRRWYPPLVLRPPCPSVEVVTVDRPETAYPDDVVYDMEAAGFYSTANRFVSAELIQVIKVISDNREMPAARLNAAAVGELISTQLATIVDISTQTETLAAELSAALAVDCDEVQRCVERFRFSESERYRLRATVRRWQTLYPNEELPLQSFTSGRQVLSWLLEKTDF